MNNIETKQLKFDDSTSLQEKFLKNAGSKSTTNLRGHVVFKDENGNIILEKDNLIVLRGRTFVLEQIFKQAITDTQNTDYIKDLNRKVCLFKIGDGGANVQTAPFNPFVPEHTDEQLAHALPFVTVDPDKNLDPVKQKNPSILTELSDADKLVYHNPVKDGTVTHYMCKSFNGSGAGNPITGTEWGYNKINNEVFIKCNLLISVKDARNQYLNELGLYFAQYVPETKTYKNIEMFSRITFDTESCTNFSKQIQIEYYIYA